MIQSPCDVDNSKAFSPNNYINNAVYVPVYNLKARDTRDEKEIRES
jgi:hypothetical protein